MALRLVEPAGRRSTGSHLRASRDEAPPQAPAIVYLLADNLDAALAAGEDLLKQSIQWNGAAGGTADDIAGACEDLRAALNHIRTLEMIIAARVLKTRERAEELGRRDARFAAVARLYNGGTAIMIEAAVELGDPAASHFETGNGATAYLRSRGLIAVDQPAPADGARLAITEELLIAGRIRLGTLMDLAARFLDTLETHYELFPDELAQEDDGTAA